MDGTVDASTAEEGGVRGVDDGVDPLLGEVAEDRLDPGRHTARVCRRATSQPGHPEARALRKKKFGVGKGSPQTLSRLGFVRGPQPLIPLTREDM